ncbi:cytochrome c biogenesis CcdA family protein [Mycobacterium ostraviense]|uniref:Cytochrome C biogenesis transmembrane region family protein n=1 Tax=Mycobacterium ostraviense TaxID=2738409 RepID=A0A162F3S9_9MYCO|nr:hypothetical protein A4G28_12535 [Mycobacterium ostraviense]
MVIAGGSQITSRPVALARAGAATLVMSAGFLTVFGIFGLLIAPLIASAQQYVPFATVIIGVLLIGLAAWLLTGRDIAVVAPKLSGGAPTARLRSMYGYGVAYAVASLSCTIGPFLALISTTFRAARYSPGFSHSCSTPSAWPSRWEWPHWPWPLSGHRRRACCVASCPTPVAWPACCC